MRHIEEIETGALTEKSDFGFMRVIGDDGSGGVFRGSGELKMRRDLRAVVELLGRADDGVHLVLEVRHVLEELGDLLAFPDELGFVVEVLILATAALTEQGATGVHPVRGSGKHLDEVGFGEVLLIAKDAGAHAFAGETERNHDDPAGWVFFDFGLRLGVVGKFGRFRQVEPAQANASVGESADL